MSDNIDHAVVADFGREWSSMDQSGVSAEELAAQFARYFAVFPWDELPPGAIGFDFGCGSGRWARFAAPRVGTLLCIDASSRALEVARRNLAGLSNCTFHEASPATIPLADGAADFCYSLGVLHHVPDTAAGIRSCAAKLKPGAPMLLYLYYALDNRPFWFRALWLASNGVRIVISRLPYPLKRAACETIAAVIYWPLSRFARLAEKLGAKVRNFPLNQYRHHSYYTLRTDALDRFGTRLEQRFSRAQITSMMAAAGLVDIRFSEGEPYWCAVGRKR